MLSNILANIAVAFFRVNVCLLGVFWKPSVEQMVGCEWDVTKLIGGVEEQVAIQLVMSMWLRKRGDERSFSDHVNQ
jgi:hypothetical protein